MDPTELKKELDVPLESRKTRPLLTLYEAAALFGTRAAQLQNGAMSTLPDATIRTKLDTDDPRFFYHLAELEFLEGRSPFYLLRSFPDGTREAWPASWMQLNK
jgi:hypothetical protein